MPLLLTQLALDHHFWTKPEGEHAVLGRPRYEGFVRHVVAFEDYSCVTYWSDRRVVDVTSQAKWGTYKNDGQDPPVTPSTCARFGARTTVL